MAVMMRTMLEVADNSGARKLQMILPLGGSTGLRAGLGDVITASVKEAAPDGQVQKGKVVKAVIVRTRKEHRRRDGTYIRFDQNAAVLINETGEPVGTRVFGPASSTWFIAEVTSRVESSWRAVSASCRRNVSRSGFTGVSLESDQKMTEARL